MNAAAAQGGSLPPAVVTIAARYGAGGSVVGPRVSERLGVPFLDRVIDARVAEGAGVPETVVRSYQDKPRAGVSRLVHHLAQVAPLDAPSIEANQDENRIQEELAMFLAERAAEGAVILGRGANFVLRGAPGVLSVLLTGPVEARRAQAMRILAVDEATARRDLETNDRARLDYVRRNFGARTEDVNDYHVTLDSTSVDLDTVCDIIVTLSLARRTRDHAVG